MKQFPIIAAVHTPMRADGTLHLDIVPQQAQHLRQSDATGVFVAGTTGEGLSLSIAERLQLTEAWASCVGRAHLRMFVSVSHNSQAEAIRLTAHANEIGAHGIACQAPSYFKPGVVEDLVNFLAPMVQAAGEVPFFYYDIPPLTGVDLSSHDVAEQLADRFENFGGVKFSNANSAELLRVVHARANAFQVYYGIDEALLAAVALGVRGAIGSTYNFATPIYRKMLTAWEAGDLDMARRWQLRSVELVHTIQKFNFLPASKAVMGLLGIDCGPVRTPFENLSPEQLEQLRDALMRIDFFSLLEPTATFSSMRS